MKSTLNILCKLIWGAFLLLSSVYLLLAYLPYTYVALVKAPPFTWVLWFVVHYSLLYWMAWIAGVVAFWRRSHWLQIVLLGAEAALGIFLPRFMGNPPCDKRAYAWALTLPLLVGAIAATSFLERANNRGTAATSHASFDYFTGALTAVVIAVLATFGEAHAHVNDPAAPGLHLARLELAAWSLVAHVLVAIAAISLLNLIYMAAFRTRHPKTVRQLLVGFLLTGALWFGLSQFLENALSFHGWQAYLYAGTLAAALTLLGFSVAISGYEIFQRNPKHSGGLRMCGLIAACLAAAFALIEFSAFIGGSDWSGFLQAVVALACWLTLSLCAYALRPPRAKYSVPVILAVLIIAIFTYKSLQATEIFWSKALGSTDGDVQRALDGYAEQDASFNLAHQLLGNTHQSDCGDLCRIMREYANIRDAQAKTNVDLVKVLKPTTGERPDIFLFVIDSVRPDYLGAYNPKVDFSPNLDAFARDSIVVHNVYTQYAGTSLSEPVIWSGMELLHAHYMQPFARVNSLEKLADVDGYRMMVSWDDVLRQLLPDDGHIIKLDTDKALWNEFEVCSTIQQTERALDSGTTQGQPVFFYAQPKNVHQFARNNLPGMRASHWQARPGFEKRITYEIHQVDDCMGQFFAYLKARGRYDNSIIVVTSDHGDATGEFGRSSHSLSLYPEVMRVPLLVHLPAKMRQRLVYDDQRISALTDIAPSLYYLLGHGATMANPLFGHPLFAATSAELQSYRRDELFMASDERAVFGILAGNGRYFYATYDSPAKSYLYDLSSDPLGIHDVLTPALKKDYDQRVIAHLQAVADFYGYRPRFWTLVASSQE